MCIIELMTNPTLHLYRGLPGSGKTTLALKTLDGLGTDGVRVNRDDLRTEVAGDKYHDGKPRRDVENKVTQIQEDRIVAGLRSGKTVIVDDTNLNVKAVNRLVALAIRYDAKIEVTSVNVPVEVAIQRNEARGGAGGRLVPEHVIRGMAERGYANGNLKDLLVDDANGRVYAVPQSTRGGVLLDAFNKDLDESNPVQGNKTVLVDCDGTLANNAHHAAYAFGRPNTKRDYGFFFRSIGDAPVNEAVRDLVNRYRDAGFTVFMLTGRSDEAAQPLIDFVKSSGANLSRIIAKRQGDFRPDYVFKAEVLEALTAEGLDVVAAIDDRPQSIRVWDSRGIHVDRVDYVDPVFDPDNLEPVPEPFVNTPHIAKIEVEYLG